MIYIWKASIQFSNQCKSYIFREENFEGWRWEAIYVSHFKPFTHELIKLIFLNRLVLAWMTWKHHEPQIHGQKFDYMLWSILLAQYTSTDFHPSLLSTLLRSYTVSLWYQSRSLLVSLLQRLMLRLMVV